MSRVVGLFAWSACVVLGLGWLARTPDEGVMWRAGYATLHGIGFVGLLVGLRGARLSTSAVIGGAIMLRVLVLPELPTLSDDGYRYLWDGLVGSEASVSPYDHRPSDPTLRAWQEEPIYGPMNSPHYYSVYPPASQVVFRFAGEMYRPLGWRGSWWLLKGMLFLVECIGILALAKVAGATRAALYAWCPLPIMELAGQGHTEALVVGGLGLLLWAERGRWPLSSLGTVIAGLAKLYPLAFLPFAIRREGRAGALAAIGLMLVLILPVWSLTAFQNSADSLALFFGTLDAFSLPYRSLKMLLYSRLGEDAGALSSTILVAGWLLAIVGVWLVDDGTRRSSRDALLAIVVGSVLVTTTLHPWYLVPALFVVTATASQALKRGVLWLAACSPLIYVVAIVPSLDVPILLIGWGGAVWSYLSAGHGDATWSTESTVAVRASNQIPSS